ncbi:MAG: 30S ribosomal protein S4 [Candidatus Thermoplasmatota archaeon]|jgi:small subunit ribosomal protein S4|nr:30S ribosomal protein S4 [Candidatus Thermoplasmatota archaeon]
MGDPKFPHKKYSAPRHPWEKTRIDEEKEVVKKYGLKNKRELWRTQSVLESFRAQARYLQAKIRYSDEMAMKQFQLMIRRLNRYSILGNNASLDDVLSLNVESILERRFQTLVVKKNLARSPKQARQLITHGHIFLNGRRVTIPGILVEGSEEESIGYSVGSPLLDDLHPIRQSILGTETHEDQPEKEAPAEEAEPAEEESEKQ